ncbi:MAG: thioredoxin family protein [Pyrinomonadaceae bacterium]|nr:thioredoxin family protein [Pyrinomonadaceae bacterium]
MSNSVKPIGDADFKTKVINSNKPVLVGFWADWSIPSKVIMPSLEAVAAECGEAEIFKLNVDDNASVPSDYQVLNLPTLLMFKKGELVNSFVGTATRAVIKNMVMQAVHSGGQA